MCPVVWISSRAHSLYGIYGNQVSGMWYKFRNPRICTRNLKVFKFHKKFRNDIVILHKGEGNEKRIIKEINDDCSSRHPCTWHIDCMR